MKKQTRKARPRSSAKRKSRLNQLIVIAATILLAAIMNEALGPPIVVDVPVHQSPGEFPVGRNLVPLPEMPRTSVAQIPRRDR